MLKVIWEQTYDVHHKTKLAVLLKVLFCNSLLWTLFTGSFIDMQSAVIESVTWDPGYINFSLSHKMTMQFSYNFIDHL